MLIRLEAKDGPKVESPRATIEQFAKDVRERQSSWAEELTENPDGLGDLEQEIHQHFETGAGHLVAALLADVSTRDELIHHVERVQENATCDVRAPQQRPLKVKLLCGLVLYIMTFYCAPGRRSRDDPQEEVVGLYPELAAFGFGKGCSPALQYKVARTVALSPSIEAAREELRRQGVKLDKKTVRRLAVQLGEQLLEIRCRELMAWRSGELPMGDEFAGCRIAVQIDGGRIRMRESKKQQRKRKKGQRRKFDTPWREPKVLTIFEFDERGKMTKKKRQPLIDGTLLGADNVMELAAYHLYRLGAARAKQVVFISDGAQWIWDRLDGVVKRAGLDNEKVQYVLDFYHAAHHIGLALKQLGLGEAERKSTYRELRNELKSSRYDKVVKRLIKLAKGQHLGNDFWREIRYLRAHGDAGHMRYATFRRRGLPCGSGAIESAIRRVINLRLKSNSIYWLAENAEAIFAVRALILTNRWDETLERVRKSMRRNRRIDWKWQAPDLFRILKMDNEEAEQIPQSVGSQEDVTTAA